MSKTKKKSKHQSESESSSSSSSSSDSDDKQKKSKKPSTSKKEHNEKEEKPTQSIWDSPRNQAASSRDDRRRERRRSHDNDRDASRHRNRDDERKYDSNRRRSPERRDDNRRRGHSPVERRRHEDRRDDRRDDDRRDNDRRKRSHSRERPANDNRRGGGGFKQRRFNNKEEDDGNHEWGKKDMKKEPEEEVEKDKPNFGLSGKLTEETNKYKGIVIKYAEPPESKKPKRRWRFYPFKGETALPTLYIHRQSAFLIGRDRKICDIAVDHPSCSKQHAALQYRLVPYEREDGTTGKRVRPYIIDLESANGTFVNNKQIDPRKYVELLEKDVVKFGFSSREYVLLHEASKDEAEDDEVADDEPAGN